MDKYAKHRKRPLEEHIKDWYRYLVHRGMTKKQADLLHGRVVRVINGCGFERWPDLSASKVQSFIAEQRKPNRKKDRTDATPGPASVQTKNFYLQAIKQFCRWMVEDGRAPDNPLAHLKVGNVRLD